MSLYRVRREYKRAYARVNGLFGHGEEEKLKGFAAVEKFVKVALENPPVLLGPRFLLHQKRF